MAEPNPEELLASIRNNKRTNEPDPNALLASVRGGNPTDTGSRDDGAFAAPSIPTGYEGMEYERGSNPIAEAVSKHIANLSADFAMGYGNLIQGTGKGMEWAGIPGGQTVSENGQGMIDNIADPNNSSKPGQYGVASDVLQSLPFTIATMPVGLGGAALGGRAAAALGGGKIAQTVGTFAGMGVPTAAFEGGTEAGDAYQQALKEGRSEEEARQIGNEVFAKNLAFLTASNALQFAPFTKAGREALANIVPGKVAAVSEKMPAWMKSNKAKVGATVGAEVGSEGLEETSQENFKRGSLGQETQWNPANWDEEMWRNFNAGAAMGGMFAAGAHVMGSGRDALEEQRANAPNPADLLNSVRNQTPSTNMPEDVQSIIDGANKPSAGTALAVADGVEDSDLSHTNPSIVQRAEALNKFAIDNFGKSLTVSGGWRSPENNARSNGAENSRHLSGGALDISTEGLNDEQRQLLFKMAGELGFDTNEDVIYHDRGSGYHMHLQDAGSQQNAQQGRMSKEAFFNAVAGQESGGDYAAENGRTGAFGKYQIMPDNWPSWSQEAGLEEGAPMTPENQEKVARYKLGDYYDKYGPEGALVAWYSGEGNAQRWAEGKSTAMGENGEYSWDAKQGKGDEPSVREYVQQSLGRAGVQPGGRATASSIADGILNSPPMFSTDGGIIDFASDKYNTSSDPSEVNFFADMMDKNDKFINTPENRKAVEEKYGDELKAYLAEQQDQKNLQELAGQNQQPSLEYALMEAQAKNKHAASLEEEAARLLRINSSSAQGKALLEKAGAYRKSAAEKTKSFSDKETEQLRQQGQPQAPAVQPTNLRTQVMPELLQALQKAQAAKFDQAEEGSLNAAVQSEEKAQQEREAQKQAVLAKKAARAEAEQRLLQLTGNQGSIITPSLTEQPTQAAAPTPGFLQTAEDKIEQKQRARVTDALNAGNIRQAVGLAEKFNRQDLANIILSSQPQQHGGPIVIANAAKGQKLYTTVKETGTKSERREYGASLANVVNAIAAKRFYQAALQGMPQEHQLFYDFLKYYQVSAQKVLDVLREERDNEINQHMEVMRNQWNEPGTKAVVARTEHGTPITRNYSGKFQWQQQLEANGRLNKAEIEPALRKESIRQLSEGYIDPKYGEQVPQESVAEWNTREAAIHGIEDYIQRAEPFEEPRATGQDLRGSGQDDLRREVAQQAIAYAGSNGTDGSVEGRQEVTPPIQGKWQEAIQSKKLQALADKAVAGDVSAIKGLSAAPTEVRNQLMQDAQKRAETTKGEPIHENTTTSQRENTADQIQNPEPQPSQTAATQENVTNSSDGEYSFEDGFSAGQIREGVAEKDFSKLWNMLSNLANKKSAAYFNKITGLKLPRTLKERKPFLEKFTSTNETPTNVPVSAVKTSTTEKTQEVEARHTGKAAQQEEESNGNEIGEEEVSDSLKEYRAAKAKQETVLQVGNIVYLKNGTAVEIVENADPSLLKVKLPNGSVVNAGKKAVSVEKPGETEKTAAPKQEDQGKPETTLDFDVSRKEALKAKLLAKSKPKKLVNVVDDSDAALAEALADLKGSLDNLSTNPMFNPDLMGKALRVGLIYAQRGVNNFAEWSEKMTSAVGDKITPYLPSTWSMINSFPEGKKFDADTVNELFEYAGIAHKEGHTTEEALSKVIAEDLGEEYTPFAKMAYNGIKGMVKGGESDVHGSANGLASRDGERGNQDRLGGNAESGRPDGGSGQSVLSPTEKSGKQGGGSVRDSSASLSREVGHSGVQHEESGDQRTGGSELSRSVRDSLRGESFLDDGRTGQAVASTQNRSNHEAASKRKTELKQQAGDLESIKNDLPMLLPEQQEDVLKAERRLLETGGQGMMFTNGTGTGKTYTGLGIIKRLFDSGKKNILIVNPGGTVTSQWIDTARDDFGLTVTELSSTKDKGEGVVITTYANLEANKELVNREWDLVVADESHKLMQAETGKATGALENLRAITLNPRSFWERFKLLHRTAKIRALEMEIAKKERAVSKFSKENDPASRSKVNSLTTDIAQHKEDISSIYAKMEDKRKALVEQWKTIPADQKPKVVFLSATPFAYDKCTDYGEGYLYDYPEESKGGYNSAGGRDSFMMQHFGYRMRYNKLTRPDAQVDNRVMEVAFHEWLKSTGVLSGRALEVNQDYDRGFILVDGGIGKKFDEGFDWLSDKKNGDFRKLYDVLRKQFNGNACKYLLENIKAKECIPLVKEYLASGKKVVLFHQSMKAKKAVHPFRLGHGNHEENVLHQYELFKMKRPDLLGLNVASLLSPRETLQNAFGDDIMMYNGETPKSEKDDIVRQFQDDNSGKNLILVQQDAGNAGISLHDTTGKHQRVLINLSMPTRPIYATQIEGRIYRVGSASNAIFRYLSTGTAIERSLFASTIASRASTAENLAMGNQARGLRDSFVNLYMETMSDDWQRRLPGDTEEGTGGKEMDAPGRAGDLTEFERAKSFYFGRQKKNSRNKAQEGKDYFATPEPLGLKMVEWADPQLGESVLEPSAGHGAISRFFSPNTTNTIVEPSEQLASQAHMVTDNAKLVNDTFENLNLVNKFDAVVMNPPFGMAGRTAIDHVAKAAKHLRDGGRVVALIPEGSATDKFDKWYESDEAKGLHMVGEVKLPSCTFERAGTSVRTRIVILEKQTNPERSQNIWQKNIDLSNADSIKELFDRIENITMPDRQEVKEKVNTDAGEIQAEAIDPEGKYAVTGNTYAVKDDLRKSGFRWNPEHKAWVGDGNAVGKFKDQASEGELKSLNFVRKDGDDSYKIKRSQDASDDEDAFSDEDLKELLAYRGQDVNFISEEKINSRERSIASMGETMGVKVRFFVGASSLRGFHFGDVTYINRKGNRGPAWTFWHEHMHWLRNNDEALYQDVLQAVEDASHVTDKQVEAYRNTIALGDKMDRSGVVEEMLADELADAVSRRGLLDRIAMQDKSLFYRLGEFFQKVIAKLKAAVSGQEEQRDSHLNLAQVKALEQQVRQAFGLAAVDGKRLYTDRSKFPYKEVPAYSSEEQESEQRNEEDTDIRYSADSSNVRQRASLALDTFAKKMGWRAKENVEKVDEGIKGMNPLKSFSLSPSTLKKTNPAVRFIVNLANKAIERNEALRNQADRKMQKIEKLLKSKEDRETFTTLLWLGDTTETEWTNQQLRDQGYSDNIVAAYRMFRSTSDYFYRLANDTRQQAQVKSESITLNADEEMNKFKIQNLHNQVESNQFNKVLKGERVGDRYVLTWREPRTYEKEIQCTGDELEALQNNPDVQVLKVRGESGAILDNQQAIVKNAPTLLVTYREQTPAINKRKGYVRHLFNSFLVYSKTKEGGWASIGSFDSFRQATKFANTLDPNGEYLIRGKTFQMPGAAEAAATVGDRQYFKIMGKLEDQFQITASEAQELMDGKVKMKNRGRFLCSILQRKGAGGYEMDALKATRRHWHEVSRFVALDPFKRKSISAFERFFGRWDDKHQGDAEFIQGYINDVNGNPTKIEQAFNRVIFGTPFLGKMLKMHDFERPGVSLFSTSMKIAGVLSLGLPNVASSLINLTQLLNAGAVMKDMGAIYNGMKLARWRKKISLADRRILKEAGVDANIGLDIGAGYTASSRFTTGISRVAMYPFQTMERFARVSTVLGAYHQGINKGMTRKEAINYAREVNDKANFNYSIADTPRFIRFGGPVTQASFQFKKYPVKMLELMWDFAPLRSNDKTAVDKLRFWLPYLAISGVWGVPWFGMLVGPALGMLLKFLFDADGDDWETVLKNETFKAAAGNKALEAGVKAAWYGGFSFAGVDISKRAGIGDFGAFGQMPKTFWEAFFTAFGPGGNKLYNTVVKAMERDPIGAIQATSPGLGSVIAATLGHKEDSRGRIKTVYEGAYDRVVRGLGFRTMDEALDSDVKRISNDLKKDKGADKRRAIDRYIDDPTPQNLQRLRDLGVKMQSVREEMRKKELTDVDRARKSMTRRDRRDTDYLNDYLVD